MHIYSETTHSINVQVKPIYLEDESVPEEQHYLWAYYVRIENDSNETVQLINRYWQVTDGNGNMQEVRGPGVVGEQPLLKPGEHFEYASGTHLPTPSGIMRGYYEMQRDDGTMFTIDIPAFSLDSTEQIARPN